MDSGLINVENLNTRYGSILAIRRVGLTGAMVSITSDPKQVWLDPEVSSVFLRSPDGICI